MFIHLVENNMIWYLYKPTNSWQTDKVSSHEGLFILSIHVTHYFINYMLIIIQDINECNYYVTDFLTNNYDFKIYQLKYVSFIKLK